VVVLAIGLALGIQLVFAWTEPELEPPYGNVGAPINTGSDYQKKTGDLGVNFLYGDDIRLGNWTQNPISSGGNIVLHNSAGTETIDINGDSGELTVSSGITTDTLTASSKITSNGELCIAANCVTSWDEVGGGGGLTCATCDAQGNLKIATDKKLIITENDGEIFRSGGQIIFQADDEWQWYSSWSMQNEMTLHYVGPLDDPALTNGLQVRGKITAPAFEVGDITFKDQKTQEILWRMFEDEEGLYLENVKTGKVYRFVLEEVE